MIPIIFDNQIRFSVKLAPQKNDDGPMDEYQADNDALIRNSSEKIPIDIPHYSLVSFREMNPWTTMVVIALFYFLCFDLHSREIMEMGNGRPYC